MQTMEISANVLVRSKVLFHNDHHTFRYQLKMTRKRATILIVLSPLVGLQEAVLNVIQWKFATVYAILMLFLYFLYAVLITTVFLLYICAYISVRARIECLNLNSGRCPASRKRSDAEFAKGMMLVLASVFICYVPKITLNIVYFIGYITRSTQDPVIHKWIKYSGMAVISNSTFNAIILVIFNKDIKACIGRFCKPKGWKNDA